MKTTTVLLLFLVQAFGFAQYGARYNVSATSVARIPVMAGQQVTVSIPVNLTEYDKISNIELPTGVKTTAAPTMDGDTISKDITIPEDAHSGDEITPVVTDAEGDHTLQSVVFVVDPPLDTAEENEHGHSHTHVHVEEGDCHCSSKWWWLAFAAGGLIIGLSARKKTF